MLTLLIASFCTHSAQIVYRHKQIIKTGAKKFGLFFSLLISWKPFAFMKQLNIIFDDFKLLPFLVVH